MKITKFYRLLLLESGQKTLTRKLIFCQNPGPTNVMDADKQEINFLELVFMDEIDGILVRETNLHAQDRREAGSEMESSFTKEEIKARLGIRM